VACFLEGTPHATAKENGRLVPFYGVAIGAGIAPAETSRRRWPAKGVVDGLGTSLRVLLCILLYL
jgi:hypothetical protein